MQNSLSERFQAALRRGGLILPNETVFVACSGGPDSTALFYLLLEIQKAWKLKLGLIHFNHGLRKVAGAEERFVRELARKAGVRFLSGKGQSGLLAREEKFSIEEAARSERYDFFQKACRQFRIKKIVTAHTQDDQAETILMRVFQGTGLRGLCGIRRSAVLGSLCVVRPLLDFSKQEILDYLKHKRAAFCRDLSNRSLKMLRNRIRLRLIPWLEKNIQPRIRQAAARIPQVLSEESELLEDLERKAWAGVQGKAKKGELILKRGFFLKLPPPIQFRVLDRALRQVDPKSGLNFEAWQRLRAQLGRPTYCQSLPRDVDFILTPSKIRLCVKLSSK